MEITANIILWAGAVLVLFFFIVYLAIRLATAPIRKESERQSRILGEIAANSGVEADLVNKILND